MNVTWAATSPETGRYAGVFAETSAEDLRLRLQQLEQVGSGYLELHLTGHEWPMLMVSFHGQHAVVHRQREEGIMDLLAGDGSVPMDDVIEVPVMDDEYPGSFTGEFVSRTPRVVSIIDRFLVDGQTDELGDWYEM